ncbi:Asp23/Gls24 family envelope stress response protein [Amycolatopsis sp. OK19-0408]|uniref:Asp23/Gls24 family envelope stress response protein n=1 Tax=Amycolatopsis iheyensis TaxID=2945988 RepID=A0A9X2SN02_9PSEU|nr:Asp23/Gls24 family envelope stress response protein [Amycolatopsis iheyensis]MCR6486115.1 Asp23/Gls24 family envelope stress response protein [Amycolatopsis iheyensis]
MAEHSDPERDPRWEAVRRAAARRVPTPPGLVERVLRAVARGRRTAVEVPGETGSLRVTGHVVARLAEQIAASRAPEGVRISAVAVEDDAVQVLVSVRFGTAAEEAAEALRRELTAELARQLDVAPTVNVHVVDVHPD